MDSKKGVLIVGIPLECTEREISETVRTGLRPLTAYRLLNRIFRREDGANAVFLELAETVSYSMLPRQIPGRGGFWDVVATPHNLDVEFLSRLNNFLKDEDRRSTDVAQALGYDRPLQDTQPENCAQVQTEVPQLLSENSWYRKLSEFSGDNHAGPEAEKFEVWLEQVTETMATWQVSEAEKRRRLLESLRGSAQSIMRVLKANNEALTTKQCLDALKEIFGSKEDYRAAQFQFLQSFPMPGEKVSSFLLRLEPLLYRAVQCNPLSTHNMDTIRLKHTLARTSMSCALQSRLEVLDQRGCPPTFLELIRIVREEEAWEAVMSATQEAQQQFSVGHLTAANCSLMLTEFVDTSTQTPSCMFYREESKAIRYASPAGPGAGRQLESVQAFGVEKEKESRNELGAGALSHPHALGISGSNDAGRQKKGMVEEEEEAQSTRQAEAPRPLLAESLSLRKAVGPATAQQKSGQGNRSVAVPVEVHVSQREPVTEVSDGAAIGLGTGHDLQPAHVVPVPERTWSQGLFPSQMSSEGGERSTLEEWQGRKGTCKKRGSDRALATCRRGTREIKPVFRIVYTALGLPHEGSFEVPLRK